MQNRLAGSLSVLLLLAGCATKDNTGEVAEKTAAAKKANPPPARYKLKMETSKGNIVIDVDRAWAPNAADRFWELATSGYYDDARFYRVLREFIAQFGIAKDPKVSERWRGLNIPDDPPGKLENMEGTVAFAKSGPNSRNTHVFINLKNNPELDREGFVPFARVVEGLDVAKQLYARYGETANRGGGGPDPVQAELRGNEYLERQFTQLDFIKKITVAGQ